MIDTDHDDAIKLIDFGLAHHNSQCNSSSDKIVGTPEYLAPEVIKGEYDEKSDMWSIGVMLFVMLSGRPPFGGGDDCSDKEVLEQVQRGKYEMLEEDWEDISNEAKDLVNKLLILKPEERISASEAIKHPWIAENTNRTIGK